MAIPIVAGQPDHERIGAPSRNARNVSIAYNVICGQSESLHAIRIGRFGVSAFESAAAMIYSPLGANQVECC